MTQYPKRLPVFGFRTFLDNNTIEKICIKELKAQALYPSKPGPIRIDRFIEKRFNIIPEYEDLTDSILGYTRFTENGVDGIVLSRSLADDEAIVARRRLLTTMAHEAGHGILHARLYKEFQEAGVLCRDVEKSESGKNYGGKWEYQANRAMAALLLPTPLVMLATAPFGLYTTSFGAKELNELHREEATIEISNIFDVNPVVARYRLADLYPVVPLVEEKI